MMTSMSLNRLTGLVLIFVLGLSVYGQESPPPPVDALTARVVSVSGIAQKMQADVQPAQWTQLKAQDTLSRHTVIRTGLNSQVVLQLADRGRVVVDSGTKVGITEFVSLGGMDGQVKARIGLKYGSMLLKVDKTRGANDFSVATAVATLSVRGTEGRIAFSADRGLFLYGQEGTFQVEKGPTSRQVGAGQRTNGKLDRSSDMKDQQRDIQMGDTGGGLTPWEKANLFRYGSGRGILGYTGNPSAGQGSIEYIGETSHIQQDDYYYYNR